MSASSASSASLSAVQSLVATSIAMDLDLSSAGFAALLEAGAT
jgi:hypothetical protein